MSEYRFRGTAHTVCSFHTSPEAVFTFSTWLNRSWRVSGASSTFRVRLSPQAGRPPCGRSPAGQARRPPACRRMRPYVCVCGRGRLCVWVGCACVYGCVWVCVERGMGGGGSPLLSTFISIVAAKFPFLGTANRARKVAFAYNREKRCAHLLQNCSTTLPLVQKTPNGAPVAGNELLRGAKILGFSSKSRV